MEPPKKSKKKRSEGEIRVSKLLSGLDILSKEEVRFPQCRDKNPLPFDFLIIVNGRAAVIEIDGEQHFMPVIALHVGEEELKGIKRRDIIKNRFLRERSISLLRVSYTELNHLEKHITDFITNLKSTKVPIYIFVSSLMYTNPFDEPVSECCIT